MTTDSYAELEQPLTHEMSNLAVLKTLGAQLKAMRLAQNIDQQQLSFESGVPLRTLSRLENGHAVSMDVFIKVLRALNLLDRLELLTPAAEISPVRQAQKRAIEPRQRASGTRATKSDKTAGKVSEPEAKGWSGFSRSVLFEDKENQ